MDIANRRLTFGVRRGYPAVVPGVRLTVSEQGIRAIRAAFERDVELDPDAIFRSTSAPDR